MKKATRLLSVILLCIFLFINRAGAQCSIRPLPLEQRVIQSKYIVIGEVTKQHTYKDAVNGNINTLNEITVSGWMKNQTNTHELFVITLGGIYRNEATLVDPSLQLEKGKEYILMLEADNKMNDDKSFRQQHPDAIQVFAYADQQGAMLNFNNSYYDIGEKIQHSETVMLSRIQLVTGEPARKPSGELFQPRQTVNTSVAGRITAISGFSPTTTRGGTIVPGDFITITGSGFGAAAGTVFFSNANDGGATFTSSGIASDNVSWSDGSITVKVAQNAGTGPINVNGAMTSATNLTVNYGHTAINSTFSGFAVSTRQRYYHRNMNGLGGYTYLYNTTSGFSANAPAIAAFERAMATWRCATFINWRSGGTTANGFAADGVNVVLFDATLPVGVLGRATSRFTGSANGACNLDNTVWCANELDIQFYPDPPVAGFPWQYGPAAPSFSEYDFESVALHELGHHHGLQHVINPGAVMHYALANGSSNRVLSGNDVAGGTARMAYSTAATCLNPAAGGTGAMTSLTPANCSTLPVSLISFTGEKKEATLNKLDWITTHEQNSRGYFIQRSSDGVVFIDIGFMAGAGNSNQLLSYTFSDNKTGPYSWYYRLRMTDKDQRETYSSVIFIRGDDSGKWKVWTGSGDGKIYVFNINPHDEAAGFKLYSVTGQLVLAKRLSVSNHEIKADNLPDGIYVYQITSGDEVIKGKIILTK